MKTLHIRVHSIALLGALASLAACATPVATTSTTSTTPAASESRTETASAARVSRSRVLVRGWVALAEGEARHASGPAYALLADARPDLERCYQHAILRGNDSVERLTVDLNWAEGELDGVQVRDRHQLDEEGLGCVLTALHGVELERSPEEARDARLHLVFFVQSARRPSRGVSASSPGPTQAGAHYRYRNSVRYRRSTFRAPRLRPPL